MHIILEVNDGLAPGSLLRHLNDHFFFKDTNTHVSLGVIRDIGDQGHYRLNVNRVDHAFDVSVDVDQYMIDFAETPNERLLLDLERTLGRYPTADILLRDMERVSWMKDPETDLYVAERNRLGVVFMRYALNGGFVYSPFKRLEPLASIPQVWTVGDITQAVTTGQYSALRRAVRQNGKALVAQEIGPDAFSRFIVEDRRYYKGDRCVISSDANTVTLDLLGADRQIEAKYEIDVELW